MKAKNIILKALKRNKRRLRIINPNNNLSGGHIKKADHNLVVMTDISEKGHEDWVVIVAYYAMYHSTLAVLSKIGLDSKDHATTASILEYFFGEQIDKDLLKKFNNLKDKKDKLELLEEKYIDYLWKIKGSRETVQYGISINYKETDEVMKNAREFVSKIKLLLEDINEGMVFIIHKEIKELIQTFREITKPLKQAAKKFGLKESDVSDIIQKFRKSKKIR